VSMTELSTLMKNVSGLCGFEVARPERPAQWQSAR